MQCIWFYRSSLGIDSCFPSRSCLGPKYCSLFCFCLDVQRNARSKNSKKADVQYIDLTAVTCSRSEHLTKQRRNYYDKKSQSKGKNKMYLAGSIFCFGHTLWCWRLRISGEWFQHFCLGLCCFPSQPLRLPCRRSKLIGLIAQGSPWSAEWSVRYWLLVFLKGPFPMLVQGFGNLVPFLQKPRFRWRNALLDLCRHELLLLAHGKPLISFWAPMLQCHAGCS